MDKKILKSVGKDLYMVSAGMITMQIILFITKGQYMITPTLVAGIVFMCGNILRAEKSAECMRKRRGD